jgi:hypothetical protein
MPNGGKCETDQQVSLNLVARSWPVSGPIFTACCTPDFQSFMVVAAHVTGKPDTAGRTYLLRRSRSCRRQPDSVTGMPSPPHQTAVMTGRQAGQARWTRGRVRILSHGRRWFGRRRQEMSMALRPPREPEARLLPVSSSRTWDVRIIRIFISFTLLVSLIGTLADRAPRRGVADG